MLSKLWCYRKTFENALDSKEIKPVDAKGNQLENSLEGLIETKAQHSGYLMQTAYSLEKT